MCPPLSCCYRRHAGPLPTLLYYLVRLLCAAEAGELSETQRRSLPGRLDALWAACYTRRRLRPGYCPPLAELLLPSLLEHDCCRQAVRRLVPLDEALHRSFRVSRWAVRPRRRVLAAGWA